MTKPAGVELVRLRAARDDRGSLVAAEVERELPFQPKRAFLVFDVPGSEVRGEHAHRRCHQFLVCVAGTVRVVADDGEASEEFVLDSKGVGLYLPPMTWGIQHGYSPDAVLMVLASDAYDPEDYIRTYEEFLALRPKSA
jgi:UDP-2-acetamido-3-amino-2,3-dideoxy-glucuronate N-acetyltransferase